jgi:hypothetical protein
LLTIGEWLPVLRYGTSHMLRVTSSSLVWIVVSLSWLLKLNYEDVSLFLFPPLPKLELMSLICRAPLSWPMYGEGQNNDEEPLPLPVAD